MQGIKNKLNKIAEELPHKSQLAVWLRWLTNDELLTLKKSNGQGPDVERIVAEGKERYESDIQAIRPPLGRLYTLTGLRGQISPDRCSHIQKIVFHAQESGIETIKCRRCGGEYIAEFVNENDTAEELCKE